MNSQKSLLLLPIAALAAVLPLSAQVSSVGTSSITGRYQFVYGVWLRQQSATVFGSIQFDGSGGYSLQGRWQGGSAGTRNVDVRGRYRVLSDATGQLSNPLDPLLPPLSLRLGLNAVTVSGSTLEQSTVEQHDLFIAVQSASGGRSPADLDGKWAGVHNLYVPGSVPMARAGRFSFQFDGKGQVSSDSWTFHQSDQNSGAPQTTVSSGSYSLAADGSGTFDSVFGRKRIALSADGQFLIGTDEATGQEILCAVKLSAGTGTGPTGRFYWEQLVAVAPSGADPRSSAFSWALTNDLGQIDGVGSARASGSQQFIDGPSGRVLDMSAMLGPFTVSPSGLLDLGFGGLASPGIGAISQNPQYVTWTNLTPTVTGTYSFNVLLPAPVFTPPADQTVWLDPVGAVHRAGNSASPGPFAPGTLMSVRGRGLAPTAESAPSLPLPATLSGTQILVNGQAAALYEVTPESATFVLPYATAGSGRVELQAVAAGGRSNTILVRSAPSLPALYSQAGNGLGIALAQHADGSLVTAGSPARPGEVISFYATGLGTVSGAPAEGNAVTRAAPTTVPVQLDIGSVLCEVLYAGLAPGYPGVYQINVRIPVNAASSAGANVRIHQGYTQSHPKVFVPIGQ